MHRTRLRKRLHRPTLERLEARLALAGTLGAVWVGQDGHDFAGGPSPGVGNAVQDIRIALSGLPAARAIASADVLPYGGGEWAVGIGSYSPFNGYLVRSPGSTTADVYVDPYQTETGRQVHIVVKYDDGSSDSLYFQGGTADPNLRMPGDVMTSSWVGQDGQDLTGQGPGVGPDGIIDAHLKLGNLYRPTAVTAVTVTRASGTGWAWGINATLLNNAEFLPNASDPSQGDLYINPDSNFAGQALTVSVTYADGKTDHTTVVAGATNPGLAAPAPAPVAVSWNRFNARWVGQDGLNLVGQGDVHLALDGLPAGRTVVSAMLDDGIGIDYSYTRPGSGVVSSDPYARVLGFRAGTDATRADLGFQPVRNEAGATLTVRLQLDDGSFLATQLTGGSSDPGLRAPGIAATSVVAHPGDDLNDLANRFGTVRLTAGLYPLSQPLVLNHAVSLLADPGTTLLFAQDPSGPSWTAAIKVQASHTTLTGFAVRFAGPVRWSAGISYGPAVVGATDNLDPWSPDPRVDLTFTGLDLQSPPASSTWEEAPSLFRMNNSESGRIAGNRLKGGATEVLNGPWLITGNDYLGTVPNTYCYNAFAGHYTHDVTFSSNHAEPVGPSGKTWRFLVMTQNGNGDSVLNNTVVGIGALDTDTVVCPNAYEIILTEAYRLHYEGMTASVSPDGRVVQIPTPQAGQARSGDVLSILSGSQAGQWRTIAQVINANTYLLDDPITPGKIAVSLATGFVNETYLGNTVDVRGSTQDFPLVLAGDQFGATVAGNHLIGGDLAFRITAYPSETPNVWGWTHAPFLGATVTGNTVEDSMRGGTIGVEHNSYSKSDAGRVYFSGTFQNNTGVWSAGFLAKRAQLGMTDQPRLATVGDSFSGDPGETILAVSGNRVSGPSAVVNGPTLQVVSALLNGSPTQNQGVVLPGLTVQPAPQIHPGLTTAVTVSHGADSTTQGSERGALPATPIAPSKSTTTVPVSQAPLPVVNGPQPVASAVGPVTSTVRTVYGHGWDRRATKVLGEHRRGVVAGTKDQPTAPRAPISGAVRAGKGNSRRVVQGPGSRRGARR